MPVQHMGENSFRVCPEGRTCVTLSSTFRLNRSFLRASLPPVWLPEALGPPGGWLPGGWTPVPLAPCGGSALPALLPWPQVRGHSALGSL